MVSDEGLRNSDGQTIKGSWSCNGTLITGDSVNQVSMQAEFEPGDYTIQFDLETPATSLVNAPNIRAVALITWSVRGNQVTRRVNVGNGVSVSGNAEGVRVVMVDTTDKTYGPGLGFPYLVSATMTKGTRPSVQQPPMLMPFPGGPPGMVDVAGLFPAAGSFAAFPIPVDAGVISYQVQIASLNGPIPEQGVISQANGASIATTLAACDPRSATWIPIAPGATEIDVISTLVGNHFLVMVFFGIDG